MTDSDSVHILGFLACLNNVHRELLYYRWRWHPQILKFYVKDFRTSLFPNSMMDLVHVWYDDEYWSKISHSTIPTPIHDLKVQMTKIYIPVSSLQISRHCFKDHNAENRI